MFNVETVNEVASSLASITTFKSCLPINDVYSSTAVSAVSLDSVASSDESSLPPQSLQIRDPSLKITTTIIALKNLQFNKSSNRTFMEYFSQVSLSVTQTDLNPFENKAQLTNLDILQVVLGTILLVPIRIFCLFLITLASLVVGAIITYGRTDQQLAQIALDGWRLRWRRILFYFARAAVFLSGYNRVRFKGQRASPNEARILALVPHTTFIDSLAVFLLELPCIVMAKTYFFTHLARPVQPITVDRRMEKNKLQSFEVIKARCNNESGPQILIFPEGPTTNGSCLVSFKLGKTKYIFVPLHQRINKHRYFQVHFCPELPFSL